MTRRNGTKHAGTKHAGTEHDGTGHDGAGHDGAGHDGTEHKGTEHDGGRDSSAPDDTMDGEAMDGEAMDGEAMDGNAMDGVAEASAQGGIWARPDWSREERCGLPEAIYAAGKTSEQVEELVRRHLEVQGRVLATRVDQALGQRLLRILPEGRHHVRARVWSAGGAEEQREATVAVVCAGTSDLSVAEEARVTLDWLGVPTTVHYDIGIAGLHRLQQELDALRRVDAIIAVAGMDGALPTLLAGLVTTPVVAVPTSVGYGAAFEGLGALLTMLNGCAPGIAIVNIDNGFGAAALVYKMVAGRS